MHGNLAQKTAVLWPAFNTHGKQWRLVVQAGSAVYVDMYHTAPMSAGVLFLFWFVHIGLELEKSSPVSLMCLLSFSTFQESEK